MGETGAPVYISQVLLPRTALLPFVVLAFALGACGGSSGTPGDRNVDPPLIRPRDAGPDAKPPKDDGGGGKQCTPPKYLRVQTMSEGSTLRVGYTGFAHGVPMPDDGDFTLEIFDCDEDCRICRLTGPVMRPNDLDNNRRCATNSAQACTKNSDCGVNGDCRFFLNPAVEAVIFDLTICARLGFSILPESVQNGSRMDDSPLQGTVDLASGDLQFDQFTLRIQQGLCNFCVNDPVANDGTSGGNCENLLMGLAQCDRNATTAGKNGTSYQCPWNSFGEFPLKLAPLRSSNIQWDLTADSPRCNYVTQAGNTEQKCFCGQCMNGSLCHTNSDCPSGACMELPGTKPNACMDPNWSLLVDPLPMFAVRSCNQTNVESDTERGVGSCYQHFDVPLGEGRIGVGKNASCFLDNGVEEKSIRAFGSAAPFDENGEAEPTVAALLCVPSTGRDEVSKASGFPGPGAIEVKLHTTLLNE